MIRARIAPTPSGYLHIGNALNFVLTWLEVRKTGGKLRLRIDDIDAPRAKPEYVADVFETLEWLGIDWDEGPRSVAEQELLYSQLLRKARYEQLILLLIASGKVYACECSRKDLDIKPCDCRAKKLPLDMPDTALRIQTSGTPIVIQDAKAGNIAVNLDAEMPNFVIKRRDGIVAYQIASLADDIDYDINLIIRGMDLIHSTAAQLYLASIIGATDFEAVRFYHHPLLVDEQGNKLSKSAGSTSIHAMRKLDPRPDKLYLQISKALNIKEPCRSASQLLAAYQLHSI
jgi:glutamyl-tRNA synthetase